MAKITREELLARYAAGERDFSGANLQGIDLSELDLSGINLSFAKIICVNLTRTNLSRANLSGAYLELSTIDNTIFVEANLQDSFIEGLLDSDLRRANLDRIRMHEGPIANCNMEGVSLRKADLSDVGIRSTNLRNANLEGTKYGFYMMDVDLTGATGFERKNVSDGYWNLTLPDGTFIADWETEQI